jgi:hypothetical protein
MNPSARGEQRGRSATSRIGTLRAGHSSRRRSPPISSRRPNVVHRLHDYYPGRYDTEALHLTALTSPDKPTSHGQDQAVSSMRPHRRGKIRVRPAGGSQDAGTFAREQVDRLTNGSARSTLPTSAAFETRPPALDALVVRTMATDRFAGGRRALDDACARDAEKEHEHQGAAHRCLPRDNSGIQQFSFSVHCPNPMTAGCCRQGESVELGGRLLDQGATLAAPTLGSTARSGSAARPERFRADTCRWMEPLFLFRDRSASNGRPRQIVNMSLGQYPSTDLAILKSLRSCCLSTPAGMPTPRDRAGRWQLDSTSLRMRRRQKMVRRENHSPESSPRVALHHDTAR